MRTYIVTLSALLCGQWALTSATMTTTTRTATMAFHLLLGIGWGGGGLWMTMLTTLTAIDVKTDCPVWFQGWTRDKSKCARKNRVRDLEYDLRELEAENKKLKLELKCSKKKYRRSSKEDIRNYNEWTFDKANLANKINYFSRDFMFTRHKFLKERRQDYKPSNKKSLSYFVGQKMADT